MATLEERIIIVGCGKIGGCILKSIAGRALAATGGLLVVDANPDTRKAAMPFADGVYAPGEMEGLCEEPGLFFLAAPPEANKTLLAQIWPMLRTGSVISDVSSVKRGICAVAARLEARPGASFIPGHPMAGSEKSGFDTAEEDIFFGRPWALLPPHPGEEGARERVAAVARALGAWIVPIANAAEHDRATALVSHLMQAVSSAIAIVVAREADDLALNLAGPGMASMLRLAHSSPAMWREILAENQDHVAPLVKKLADELTRFAPARTVDQGHAAVEHLRASRRGA